VLICKETTDAFISVRSISLCVTLLLPMNDGTTLLMRQGQLLPLWTTSNLQPSSLEAGYFTPFAIYYCTGDKE